MTTGILTDNLKQGSRGDVLIIIKPEDFTDSNLSNFNVTETDESEWSSVATYSTGDKVMIATGTPNVHRIYESLTDNNTDNDPVTDRTNWLIVGRTNRWKMFPIVGVDPDGFYRTKINEQTENADTITFRLTPVNVVDAVSFFNLEAQSINVTVTDGVDGEVYNNTVTLDDSSVILDWYMYFYEPISRRRDLVLLDLPPYGASATIDVTITNTGGTAKCGIVSIGKQQQLGVSNYGTSVGLTDYSRKETDSFGDTIIVRRPTAKRAEFDVLLVTSEVGAVQSTLATYTSQVMTYIGDEDKEATIIFGYYKGFQTVFTDPTGSNCTLTVEGLT